MVSRDEMAAWLEGTPSGRPHADTGRAPLGRRLLALVVDWFASMSVSALFFPADDGAVWILRGHPTATLAVFAVSTALLVGLLGTTIGHRLVGIRVVRVLDPAPRAPGIVAGLVRTVLLCLVVPAVVWDGAGRGLHDVAARTAIVRG